MNLNCFFYYLAHCSSCTILRKVYDETKRKFGTQKSHNYAIVLAIAEVYKDDGNDEYSKKNFNGAIHFYTEGIKVNCKDEDLNAKLYSNRAAAHFNLGKKLIYSSFFFLHCFRLVNLRSITYCTDHSFKTKCSFAAINIFISKKHDLKKVIVCL